MMNRFDCIGVGLYSVDFLMRVPHTPKLDEKVRAVEFTQQAGGQVATAMVALSRWGLRTSFVGKVCRDTLGEFTVRELEQEGVDTGNIVYVDSSHSHLALIMVDNSTGKRTIAWSRPDEVWLRSEDLSKSHIRKSRILHLDGYEIEASIQAARWMKEVGGTVVLDAEHIVEKTQELLRLTDILIATRGFAKEFTGTQDEVHAIEAFLRALPCKIVSITLGDEGSITATKDDPQPIEVPAYKPDRLVDTTGAGDIFHAGFIYGYYKGWGIHRIARFASVASGLKCKALGARAGIPCLKDVLGVLGHESQRG